MFPYDITLWTQMEIILPLIRLDIGSMFSLSTCLGMAFPNSVGAAQYICCQQTHSPDSNVFMYTFISFTHLFYIYSLVTTSPSALPSNMKDSFSESQIKIVKQRVAIRSCLNILCFLIQVTNILRLFESSKRSFVKCTICCGVLFFILQF